MKNKARIESDLSSPAADALMDGSDVPVDPVGTPEVTAPEQVFPPEAAKIRLNRDYIGRKSRERWIAAGIYERNDRALFGLAEYLLMNGHAEVVEEA